MNLRFNNLTNLPKEIGNLTQLNTLYLTHNNLTELPTEIGNLNNLKFLDLSNNDLKYNTKVFLNGLDIDMLKF